MVSDTYAERDLYMRVGMRVRDARKAKGMSQEALAKALSVSQQTISHIETGRARLELSRLYQLGAILEKPISYFTDPQLETETKSRL
ncbi:MAG: helix-turn-helix transcriptional regulator [Oceanicaulis sp.]|nr:helix-turn-helix transcriptional regulator [Oceanicaulis sp.]